MATYTGSANLYTLFKKKLGQGLIDLTGATFQVLLTTSSYTPGQDTHEFADDITNELSGNGYSRQTVTASWDQSGSTMTLSLTDPTFSASGGDLTARYWVVMIDGPTDDTDSPLVAYGYLDSTPANVVTTDGNDLTIDFSDANGLFQI